MTNRKLQALRNLAERPGTEAEGNLAREMLEKAQAKKSEPRYQVEQFTFDPYMEMLMRDARESMNRAAFRFMKTEREHRDQVRRARADRHAEGFAKQFNAKIAE